MPADAELSVAGIILAAGASTRFGRNKLLLPVSGDSLARRAAKALSARRSPVVNSTSNASRDANRAYRHCRWGDERRQMW